MLYRVSCRQNELDYKRSEMILTQSICIMMMMYVMMMMIIIVVYI